MFNINKINILALIFPFTPVRKYRCALNAVNFMLYEMIISENKKTMYAKVGEFFKARRGWFLMQGDIICCTSDNCNTKIPSLPSAGNKNLASG